MHDVKIIFRNGVVFEAKAESISTKHGVMHGDLRQLTWKGMVPDPLYIDLVVAGIFTSNTGKESA